MFKNVKKDGSVKGKYSVTSSGANGEVNLFSSDGILCSALRF